MTRCPTACPWPCTLSMVCFSPITINQRSSPANDQSFYFASHLLLLPQSPGFINYLFSLWHLLSFLLHWLLSSRITHSLLSSILTCSFSTLSPNKLLRIYCVQGIVLNLGHLLFQSSHQFYCGNITPRYWNWRNWDHGTSNWWSQASNPGIRLQRLCF